MAQLTDDCFAFGGPLLPVDDAIAMLAARLSAVEESESLKLVEADGRVLARDLVAPLSLPPFTNSAVDGYAVRGVDVPMDEEKAFAVVGRVQAGAAANAAAEAGQAVRVFTGAPMPQGADTVFMQEDVRLDEAGRVILPPGLRRGANVRPQGEDVAAGQTVLKAGHRMRPQDVALAAALGLTHVEARRRIRVAVLSTGNEIVAPGTPRGSAQLFDSNRFMLMAMLARLGCEVDDLGIVRDDMGSTAAMLRDAAATHDLILASGGVSTGEADFVKAAVESVGTLVFWRMAIKPGRPVAMGVIAGKPFIGLPGNPVASFVTFAHIARPAIAALAGMQPGSSVSVPLRAAFSYRKKEGRREYVRASLRKAEDGTLEAVKFPREGAGLLSSLVETDGLVELGETTTNVTPGEIVAFLPYSSLL
ncbi:molybdopterin molybdenumtransferase MoeA [Pseudaminobacter arsenicus]|uniref:Molybdopterin molybdenumtransferase n=1 Tax=Borborobacter arsenicus TaxID=1851146 RepID=A0A432V825_9HYPH|nr:gephyrin-like molybdotransferase Glp [Pseudaminobacter arsenicus]RUM98342.1 molybdopterin molybdenumtransferase MoeA [Pseudaminobacter arsenicus]